MKGRGRGGEEYVKLMSGKKESASIESHPWNFTYLSFMLTLKAQLHTKNPRGVNVYLSLLHAGGKGTITLEENWRSEHLTICRNYELVHQREIHSCHLLFFIPECCWERHKYTDAWYH